MPRKFGPIYIEDKPYYPIPLVAEITNTHPQTIRQWMWKGETSFGLDLGVIKHGSHLLMPEDKVYDLIESLEHDPQPKRGRPVYVPTNAEMVQVGRLFYEKQLSKQEIAKRLHIDARKVTWLLKEAEARGVVTIEIDEARAYLLMGQALPPSPGSQKLKEAARADLA